MSGLDSLAYRLRPAAAEPEGALVLFHGRGAGENDLFPLLDFLDPEGRLVAATPHVQLGGRTRRTGEVVLVPLKLTGTREQSANLAVDLYKAVDPGVERGGVATYMVGLVSIQTRRVRHRIQERVRVNCAAVRSNSLRRPLRWHHR